LANSSIVGSWRLPLGIANLSVWEESIAGAVLWTIPLAESSKVFEFLNILQKKVLVNHRITV
jgi:hypothetical protein